MRRREFITLISSASVAWSLAARAQEPKRRIGMLMPLLENNPEGEPRVRAFVDGLQQLGWTDGHNVRIDIRWGGGIPADRDKYAAELVALAPDVIFASASVNVAALQRITRSVPIVFAGVVDPVGAGFVASLARPGGNTTGFSAFEYSLSGKWLELLKELAPNVTRAAVLRDPSLAAGIGQFAAIQALASPSLGVELIPIDARDPTEMERAITAFAREPNGGLILTGSPGMAMHRNRIIALALQHRLPSVYAFRYYPASGGLASYGPDIIDEHRRAAAYVDRVLKGEKPADLPVQAPTKYELVINLKTAKALGITVPQTVLGRADEVIE
jgi:putative tryptophan/tyrosine transport system substrate-binding protein